MDDNYAIIFKKILEKLSEMMAPDRFFEITRSTEVYKDLNIYGDEMVNLIWWIQNEFDIDLDMNPFLYSPKEFPFLNMILKLRKILRIESKYNSLTVDDVVAKIQSKLKAR